MKSVTIGYIPWFEKNSYYSDIDPSLNDGWLNLLNYDLEKLNTWKDSTSAFTKCPAFINYVDQFWVIKSPIDIKLKWDDTKKKLSSDLSPIAHDMLIKSHTGDFNPYTGIPIVALNIGFVFVSDVNVWIDFLPPFNDIDANWRLIPGSFNIYNWQRPVTFTFEMTSDMLTIERGQPLAYLRFRSNNPQDKFKLIKQEKTDDLEQLVMSCASLKFFQKNISWKFVTGILPNRFRPKKLIKK